MSPSNIENIWKKAALQCEAVKRTRFCVQSNAAMNLLVIFFKFSWLCSQNERHAENNACPFQHINNSKKYIVFELCSAGRGAVTCASWIMNARGRDPLFYCHDWLRSSAPTSPAALPRYWFNTANLVRSYRIVTKTLFRINKGINACEIEPRIRFKKSYNHYNCYIFLVLLDISRTNDVRYICTHRYECFAIVDADKES